MENIGNILLERGYKPDQAKSTASSLLKLNLQLKPLLEAWITSFKETNFTVGDISIFFLMEKYGLRYPAALLTIDWLLREPEKAKEAMKKEE